MSEFAVRRREGEETGVVALAVEGELVLGSRGALAAAVESELGDGARRVVLDLRGATHVDMPGFAILVRLHAACRERGAELVVAGLPDSFEPISEALRLPDALRMTDDVEAALRPPS